MNLKDIWAEIEHVFHIAESVAPIMAIVDPQAASGLATAEAVMTLATPVMNQITAASPTPLSTEQVTAMAAQAVTSATNIAVQNGKISTEVGTQIQALVPSIVSIANAMAKPVATK